MGSLNRRERLDVCDALGTRLLGVGPTDGFAGSGETLLAGCTCRNDPAGRVVFGGSNQILQPLLHGEQLP
jgi:hypothetical protein